MERRAIIDFLARTETMNLISHMQPDGDSVGSLLAMGEAMRRLGKKVALYSPSPIPSRYQFMDGVQAVVTEPPMIDEKCPVVVLDSSDPDRLGSFRDSVMNGRSIVNIDHHVTNHRFGELNFVDTEAAATGEIVYQILGDLRVEIDQPLAQALYVAIATDTGSFKYENTTPTTHRVVAALMERGLNPSTLGRILFDEHPYPFYRLLKEALAGLEFYGGGRIALTTLGRDLRERCGARPDNLEGIVEFTRNIEGVELGMLVYVDKHPEIKVGFRSQRLDVSALAGKFNGGGHARAAGCRLQGPLEEIKERLIREAEQMIRDLGD